MGKMHAMDHQQKGKIQKPKKGVQKVTKTGFLKNAKPWQFRGVHILLKKVLKKC